MISNVSQLKIAKAFCYCKRTCCMTLSHLMLWICYIKLYTFSVVPSMVNETLVKRAVTVDKEVSERDLNSSTWDAT